MASEDKDAVVVVESVRQDGRTFRPSDWVERISTRLAEYGADHRLHYSESAHPCIIDGVKCLCVKKSLARENPAAYQFILNFATDNQLRIQEDRRLHSRDVVSERRTSSAGL